MTAIEFPWSSVKWPIREQGFLSHSLFAHLIPDEKGTERRLSMLLAMSRPCSNHCPDDKRSSERTVSAIASM